MSVSLLKGKPNEMKGRGGSMIDLTRINDTSFSLNSDLIETIEEVPDTVITLTTGKKIFVKESRQKVINLVKSYKKEIFSRIITNNDE